MLRAVRFRCAISLVSLSLVGASQLAAQSGKDTGWPTYGADEGGTRYSSAQQIDRNNVSQLKIAWTYRTGAKLRLKARQSWWKGNFT